MNKLLKKEKTLDKREYKKDLEKANKDLEKKPNNSTAIISKIEALMALGYFDEFDKFVDTLSEELLSKPKVASTIANQMYRTKHKLDSDLFKNSFWILFDDNVQMSSKEMIITKEVEAKSLKTAKKAAEADEEVLLSHAKRMRNFPIYQNFSEQKELLEEFIERKLSFLVEESKKAIAQDTEQSFKVRFNNFVVEQKWEEAYELFRAERLEDEKQHKTAFTLANHFIENEDFEKALEMILYCLISAKRNKDYLKTKTFLEEKLGITTHEIALAKEEVKHEAVELETKEIKKEKRVVIPLSKQIRSKDEIKEHFDNLSISITDVELDKFINIYQNEISMANIHFEVLAALSKFMLQNSRIDDALKFIDESIKLLNQVPDVKERKVKKIKKLKYSILYKGQRFDEASEYLQKENLVLSTTDKDNLAIAEEVVAEKDNNFDDPMNAIRNKYHAEIQRKSLQYYLKRVDEYINDRQFFYKFGVEVPQEVISKIKEKIALDLKYLDFEIRESLIPYLIKIESSIRYAFGINGDNVIYKFLEMVHHDYKDDHKFIFDIDKIKIEENSVFYSNQELLMEMLTVVYRITRNHVMHGTYNIFGMTMHEGHVERVNKDLSRTDIDELIDNIDTLSMSEMENVIQGISASKQMDALFDLEIVKNIMSKSAIENRRVFGLMILLLYISNPYHTFMNIASSIDNEINLFRNRTVFGSKDKIYESLGLNVNWLKAFE